MLKEDFSMDEKIYKTLGSTGAAKSRNRHLSSGHRNHFRHFNDCQWSKALKK